MNYSTVSLLDIYDMTTDELARQLEQLNGFLDSAEARAASTSSSASFSHWMPRTAACIVRKRWKKLSGACVRRSIVWAKPCILKW